MKNNKIDIVELIHSKRVEFFEKYATEPNAVVLPKFVIEHITSEMHPFCIPNVKDKMLLMGMLVLPSMINNLDIIQVTSIIKGE